MSIFLYGGTFNPIHNGHIYPVLDAAKHFNATKVIYVPCHIPPHKQIPNVGAETRYDMTNLALKNPELKQQFQGEIEVSRYEIDNPKTSYSYDTICHFKKLYNNEKLYFVMGLDSFLNFHTWKNWQGILHEIDLIVVKRPSYKLATDNDEATSGASIEPMISDSIGQSVFLFDSVAVDISSTEIRNLMATNSSKLNQHIPKAVIDYIQTHQLYR